MSSVRLGEKPTERRFEMNNNINNITLPLILTIYCTSIKMSYTYFNVTVRLLCDTYSEPEAVCNLHESWPREKWVMLWKLISCVIVSTETIPPPKPPDVFTTRRSVASQWTRDEMRNNGRFDGCGYGMGGNISRYRESKRTGGVGGTQAHEQLVF